MMSLEEPPELDRSATSGLLDALERWDAGDEALERVSVGLMRLQDPRAWPRLAALLHDRTKPDPARSVAGEVLAASGTLGDDEVRRLLTSGDEVLRSTAVWATDAECCPDLALAVAADAADPLQCEALRSMCFGFATAEGLRVRIEATVHPDPCVRAQAVFSLLFDEPVAAEPALLAALTDPDPDVAHDAVGALAWYPTRGSIVGLHAASRTYPDERVREAAGFALEHLAADVEALLRGGDQRWAAGSERVRRWARPILHLLDLDLGPDDGSVAWTPSPAPPPPAVEEALALLTDPDTSPEVLSDLARGDVRRPRDPDAAVLGPVLLTHPDPEVRAAACAAFAAWGEADALLALARDPHPSARKSARYGLGQLPRTPGVADLVRPHVHDRSGTSATEALSTFAAHCEPSDLPGWLEEVARDGSVHESARSEAVRRLVRAGATAAVARLRPLLSAAPASTWELHLALLEACTTSGLEAPEASWLAEVDHAEVQAALGSTRWQLPDPGW